MSKMKFALLKGALFFFLLGSAAQLIPAQTATQPAPGPTPARGEIRARAGETVVDATIPDDASVEKMLKPYSVRVRVLDTVIGKLKGDLKKSGMGSGSMGNFVTNGLRTEAAAKLGKPVVLAVTNGGGLRKPEIAEGDLRERDIFELLPFENALVAFDLTGEKVVELLRAVVARRDAQSGARIKYRINEDKKPQLESVRLLINGEEKEIDPAATYTVVSIDYLLNVTGGDYAAVLRSAKNIRPLGLTMRDAIISYVKGETAAGREIKAPLDGRFVYDKTASGGKEEQP